MNHQSVLITNFMSIHLCVRLSIQLSIPTKEVFILFRVYIKNTPRGMVRQTCWSRLWTSKNVLCKCKKQQVSNVYNGAKAEENVFIFNIGKQEKFLNKLRHQIFEKLMNWDRCVYHYNINHCHCIQNFFTLLTSSLILPSYQVNATFFTTFIWGRNLSFFAAIECSHLGLNAFISSLVRANKTCNPKPE